MSLRWWVGVPLGIFGIGIAVGYVAHRAKVPPDQVNRWLAKRAVRKALDAYDVARDLLPDDEPLRLAGLLAGPEQHDAQNGGTTS